MLRIYAKPSVDTVTITKIISANVITNWLGYIILVGIVFSGRLSVINRLVSKMVGINFRIALHVLLIHH